MADLRPDTTVWLTARTLSAPRICWSEPCAVVKRIEHPYVVVDVAGQEHRVHVDNVRRTDPGRASDVTHIKPKYPPLMDGYEQLPLLNLCD